MRPLMTIEPTAIQLEMPVNALIGLQECRPAAKRAAGPRKRGLVIYLAWEHVYLNQFAKRLLEAYGRIHRLFLTGRMTNMTGFTSSGSRTWAEGRIDV